MRSSRTAALLVLVAAGVAWSPAAAQLAAGGFAVERFQASAPGSSWLTASDLDLPPGLGGGASFSLRYARNPLRIDLPGGGRLAVVSSQGFAEVAMAVAFGRCRLAAFLPSPFYVAGNSGTAGEWSYTAPHVNLSHNPDTISDVRIGLEALVAGRPDGPARVGARVELVVPSAHRYQYLSDGGFRAVAQGLAAGNAGAFRWAGNLGVHLRPLDDEAPGSPRGSELLFGAAAGIALDRGLPGTLLVGPELTGASAFSSFLSADGTSLEALLGASLTRVMHDDLQFQLKVGAGAGLVTHLGAPEWRVVTGVAVSHAPRRSTEER